MCSKRIDLSAFALDPEIYIAGTLAPVRQARSQKARKAFEVEWVKLPRMWVEALRRSTRVATYQLAHVILLEAFKREHTGGEIVLSADLTGMPRSTRRRAMRELVKLGLIKAHRQSGKQAYRVSLVNY